MVSKIKPVLIAYISLCMIIMLKASEIPNNRHIELDKNGTFVLDGKKTFIYGTYHHLNDDWQDFDGLKEVGFNLTHSYHFENCMDINVYLRDAKKYLEAARRNNIGVFLGLPRNMVKQRDMKSIRRIVESLKKESALWFWYLYDEPAQGKVNPDNCYKIYQTIKSIDKQHPVVIADNRKFDNQVYAACDMIWTDRYPAPFGILPVLEVQIEAQKKWPMKKIWSVPHVHTDLEMSNEYRTSDLFHNAEHLHRPNAKDIQAILHCSLAGGARGEIIYQYCNTKMQKRRPKAWKEIVQTGQLFKKLNDILVALEPAKPAKINVKGWKTRYEALGRAYSNYKTSYPKWQSEIVAWQREYNGELYIGLINAGYQPRVKVELIIPYKFKSIIQYPQDKTVINIDKTGKWEALQKEIPVAVFNIVQGQKLELQMNECDVVVWRFIPADK